MPSRSHAALVLVLLASAACESTAPSPPTPPAPPLAQVDDLARHCADLLSAPPDAWTPAIEAVVAHRAKAAAPLVRAFEQQPDGPGAQAAIALLGRIGDAETVAFLRSLVRDRGAMAAEAALALGELGDANATEDLVRCAHDRHADATLRTAAACSAVRLGEGPRLASLLHAVMLAGTPPGRPLAADLGLPDRPRWAYERYLIQRLLADCCPEDPGFDTDAPWADLEAAGARVAAWLQAR